MSGVCRSAVDGNIEIPSGGTPQDVHVFNMAGPLEKSKEPIKSQQRDLKERASTERGADFGVPAAGRGDRGDAVSV